MPSLSRTASLLCRHCGWIISRWDDPQAEIAHGRSPVYDVHDDLVDGSPDGFCDGINCPGGRETYAEPRLEQALSRTAAKRQAHAEGKMYRSGVNRSGAGRWSVAVELGERTSTPTAGFIHHDMTFAAARRALSRWRSARVRELMGQNAAPAVGQDVAR